MKLTIKDIIIQLKLLIILLNKFMIVSKSKEKGLKINQALNKLQEAENILDGLVEKKK